MMREDVHRLVCDIQGCLWTLTDSDDPIILEPPPEPWVYFRCEHCWRVVAVHQDRTEESLTKTGSHIRTSITGQPTYEVVSNPGTGEAAQAANPHADQPWTTKKPEHPGMTGGRFRMVGSAPAASRHT